MVPIELAGASEAHGLDEGEIGVINVSPINAGEVTLVIVLNCQAGKCDRAVGSEEETVGMVVIELIGTLQSHSLRGKGEGIIQVRAIRAVAIGGDIIKVDHT